MHADLHPAPACLRAPRTVEETGLPFLFLVELLVKVLFQRGQLHLPELAAYVKLGLGVLDPVIGFMRQEKLCEVMRRGASGTDADIHYQLTDSGRQRALECLARNAYAGPCPVPLAAYNAQVSAQSVANMHVTRARVAASFDGVVVNQRVLDQLGAAMNSGRAIFIYGAAGSGKTYLAERLQDLLQGAIALPYAIMVDGEVVPFYDPVLHLPAAQQLEAPAGIERAVQLDARWVRGVRRPAVLTGGELTLEMLDLRFDSVTRLYRAPPHLKANNGIFIIDDLGRQRCSPLELMNRWIVPMDRAIDYLSLHNGHTFQVPFDVVVVFSSNFLPERLQDLLQGAIALPYANMVDGEVIPFYEPVLHLPAAQQPEAPAGIERAVQLDARWVRGVRRPAVLTGGELTLEMLDLRFDSVTRLYRAPPHLKANNGIFIIDDLGRQRCSPLELMNRWIVPMDRAIDYLSLHNGHTFQVPFDVVVVFSSNFLPERLSDAAFLRRLGYKIEVPALSAAHYETVFRQTCAAYGVPFDAAAFAFLLQRHARGATPLLACYPRDLLRQVRDLARYEGTAAQLNEQVLDWAWNNYFAGENQRHGADDMAVEERAVQERREPKSS